MSLTHKYTGDTDLSSMACFIVPIQHSVNEGALAVFEHAVRISKLQKPGPKCFAGQNRGWRTKFIKGQICGEISTVCCCKYGLLLYTKPWAAGKFTRVSDGIQGSHPVQVVMATCKKNTQTFLCTAIKTTYLYSFTTNVCVLVCSSNPNASAGHHLETADEAQSGSSGPGLVWLQFPVLAPREQT